MNLPSIHEMLLLVQQGISFLGMLVILSGILRALFEYIHQIVLVRTKRQGLNINSIRLDLGRTLILGLEFIVAADLIGTTTTPDYYTLGIVAGIVLIRTLLSFSLNREMVALTKEKS